MRWSEVIELIPIVSGENNVGDPIETDGVHRQVFANKKSIRQTEFYQAAQTDLKPELMFEVRVIDYNDEPKLEYDSKQYNIIRTYDKNCEVIELICQGLV